MAKKILRKTDCRPIRQQIKEVKQQIRDIEDALVDPDIPRPLKQSLRQELPRLKMLLRRLVAALEACEALSTPP
jgi:hypothetical protein